jgi:hypothetical protein
LPEYLAFWNKMTEHPDLWKIQQSNAGETPLNLAVTYLNSPEYLEFWDKISKYIDIDLNNKGTSQLAFTVKSSIFEKLFGNLYSGFCIF